MGKLKYGSLPVRQTIFHSLTLHHSILKLREEYTLETGKNVYDWDWIEQMSSLSLLISLAEKQCAPSGFPSGAGHSRLQTMVRLSDPIVKAAYERKRLDIRYAINQRGVRRDRRIKQLPNIPSAPASYDSPPALKNGTSVVDIEHVCGKQDDDHGSKVVCLGVASDDRVAQHQSGDCDSYQDIKSLKARDRGTTTSGTMQEEPGIASEETLPNRNVDRNASVANSSESDIDSESEAVDEDDDEYELSSEESDDDIIDD